MSSPYMLPLLVLLVLYLLVLVSAAQIQTPKAGFNNSGISAIFVFGDSTVDPGNNNYIGTPFRSDFPPYGRDFVNHIPTGRFTNGRLVTDFAASYLGIKDYLPPYLDPTLSIEELLTGVSFASASSGYDTLTATISVPLFLKHTSTLNKLEEVLEINKRFGNDVIPVEKQVEYFKDYKMRIELAIGKERTENLINKAIFVLSAGTNDYIVTYFGLPVRRMSYTVSTYHQFLMQNIQQFIQGLLDLGARKILVAGIPPIGCLPIVITLNSDLADSFHKRKCIDSLSSVAIDHNQILEQKLRDLQKSDTKILYADIYKPLRDIIQSHKKFGFNEINSGCCGTGLLEASFLCNAKSPICPDASDYVYFDAVHPTERAYYIIFKALCSTIDLLVKG